MKRAYHVTLCGIRSVVAAETRGKAILIAYRSASECGYRPDWREARVVRTPEYDGWAEVDASNAPWGEEHIEPIAAAYPHRKAGAA